MEWVFVGFSVAMYKFVLPWEIHLSRKAASNNWQLHW